MSLRFNLSFWCIVGFQMVVLLAIIGVKETTLQTGTEVVLQTVPVDPRSILQGDYVILGYEIATSGSRGSLPWTRSDPDRPAPQTPIYVTLREGRPHWVAVGYHRSRNDAGQVAIRGVMGNDGRLDFNIGTYFVPEGTGRAIETAGDVKVVAAVDRAGHAVIKRILVDGQPWTPGR
jgi:uncharacterized membrane-anchored protein